MGSVYRYLTSLLFGAVVVQVGLAGYGAFAAIHAADKHPVTQTTVENGFNAHVALGMLIVVAMLLLLLVAVAGRLGVGRIKWAGGLFLLGVLQFVLGSAAPSTPWLGSLHTVNALVIYAAVAYVAHRAWTVYRTPDTARTPTPS
jgi:hypothetical protein